MEVILRGAYKAGSEGRRCGYELLMVADFHCRSSLSFKSINKLINLIFVSHGGKIIMRSTVGNLSGQGDQEPRLPGEVHGVAWSTRPDKDMGQTRARGPGRTRLRRPDSPGFAGLRQFLISSPCQSTGAIA
jgi:hypothetical protein